VLEIVSRAYPGALEPVAPLERGLDLDGVLGLGDKIGDVLPVRVFEHRAGPDGFGDSLYLFCGLHAPCLYELREGLCARDAPMLRSAETYLRVALSPLGRFATLQESVLRLEDLGEGRRLVAEEPRAGVENGDLRTMVTGLQGLLRRERIVLLDAAFLFQAIAGPVDPAFEQRWASPPTLWNALFDPAPPTTTREVVV